LPVYLYQEENGNGVNAANRNLDFSKAHYFIICYENLFAPDWRIKAEGYHQYLFDTPVEQMLSGVVNVNG
jgi:hypothetical protein